jgi:phosphohistidine phosphatase
VPELFVLRHGKSSWDNPALDDYDRPLARRGHKASKRLAEHVRASKIDPVQILCSSSRRTRETLKTVLPGRKDALIEDKLYGASPGQLIKRLRKVPPETASVMLIGHNPAVQELILELTGAADGVRRPRRSATESSLLAEIERKFPTGALATLGFDCDWIELAPGCARLVAYVEPKSLG